MKASLFLQTLTHECFRMVLVEQYFRPHSKIERVRAHNLSIRMWFMCATGPTRCIQDSWWHKNKRTRGGGGKAKRMQKTWRKNIHTQQPRNPFAQHKYKARYFLNPMCLHDGLQNPGKKANKKERKSCRFGSHSLFMLPRKPPLVPRGVSHWSCCLRWANNLSSKTSNAMIYGLSGCAPILDRIQPIQWVGGLWSLDLFYSSLPLPETWKHSRKWLLTRLCMCSHPKVFRERHISNAAGKRIQPHSLRLNASCKRTDSPFSLLFKDFGMLPVCWSAKKRTKMIYFCPSIIGEMKAWCWTENGLVFLEEELGGWKISLVNLFFCSFACYEERHFVRQFFDACLLGDL